MNLSTGGATKILEDDTQDDIVETSDMFQVADEEITDIS